MKKYKHPRRNHTRGYTRYQNIKHKNKDTIIIKCYLKGNKCCRYFGLDENNKQYIKQNSHSRRQKYYKKYCNKAVRRRNLKTKGNNYRKLSEYYWSIW